MTRAAVPESAAPHPWGLCDMCGEAPGLPIPGRPAHLSPLYHCPACTTLSTLVDAAQAHLEDLAAPIVGAWAHLWTAAGLPLGELEEITQHVSGANMNEEAGQAYRARALRFLRRKHTPPTITHDQPTRAAFALEDLPMIHRHHPAQPERHTPAHFTDEAGRVCSLFQGLDTVALSLPDGITALIFPEGAARPDDLAPTGYRVPAHLWPLVQAALTRPFTAEGGQA